MLKLCGIDASVLHCNGPHAAIIKL